MNGTIKHALKQYTMHNEVIQHAMLSFLETRTGSGGATKQEVLDFMDEFSKLHSAHRLYQEIMSGKLAVDWDGKQIVVRIK